MHPPRFSQFDRSVGPAFAATLALLLCRPMKADALDHVSLLREGRLLHVSGSVVGQSDKGELALLSPDNTMWIVDPGEVTSRRRDDEPLVMLDHATMANCLLEEMPEGFRIHRTANYVICYNTSSAYAQWCGALYERLYRGFFSYWRHRGLELVEPDWPLVALVFDDRASYAQYARPELGAAAGAIIGYYSMHSNRVTMYDLTGADGLPQSSTTTTAAHINQILSQPAGERTVATIVHEATHQLACNSGLQQRFAGVPLWVSEGLAVYFETPDLSNAKGWRGIGEVNHVSLRKFQRSRDDRPEDSLLSLLREDDRLRDPGTAGAAYGQSWALVWYLLRRREEEFLAFLRSLSKVRPLESLSPDERESQFKAHFGHDLDTLDADLVRTMERLR